MLFGHQENELQPGHGGQHSGEIKESYAWGRGWGRTRGGSLAPLRALRT